MLYIVKPPPGMLQRDLPWQFWRLDVPFWFIPIGIVSHAVLLLRGRQKVRLQRLLEQHAGLRERTCRSPVFGDGETTAPPRVSVLTANSAAGARGHLLTVETWTLRCERRRAGHRG